MKNLRKTYIAESLESRILFSGAPVEAVPDLPQTDGESAHVSATPKTEFEGIGQFSGAIGDDGESGESIASGRFDSMVSLTTLDNLTSEELEKLAHAAAERWKATGLSEEQLAALDRVEYTIVDLDAEILGAATGYQIEIDLDAAGEGWFIDSTPFDDSEFSPTSSLTTLRSDQPQTFALDLLSVIMHEQGHVLGLEDAYDSASKGIMYGFFGEGERRLVTEGLAAGSRAGSLEGTHYALIVQEQFEIGANDHTADATITGNSPDSVIGYEDTDAYSDPGVTANSDFVARTDSLSYTDAVGNQLATSGGHVEAFDTVGAGTLTTVIDTSTTATNEAVGSEVWFSFLIDANGSTLGAGEQAAMIWDHWHNNGERLFGVGITENNQIQVFQASATPTNTGITLDSGTNLVVVRLADSSVSGGFVDGTSSGDTFELFVNPNLSGAPNGVADYRSNTGFMLVGASDARFGFNDFRIQQNLSGNSVKFDEFRIGDTFADVTPNLPPNPSDDGTATDEDTPIVIVSAAAEVTLTPSVDGHVTSSTANSGAGSYTNNTQLQVKNDGTGTSSRKAYIKFDTTTLSTDNLADAELQLTITNNTTGTTSGSELWTFDVYGLDDGNASEDWSNGTFNYTDAPGNDASNGGAINDAETTFIGSFNVTGLGTVGDVLSIRGARLVDFLQKDSNEKVTFIVTRQEDSSAFTAVHVFGSQNSGATGPKLITRTSLFDNDPGSNLVSFDSTSASGASVTVNADGSFSYDPTASATIQALKSGEMLTDAFSYTSNDGGSDTTSTARILVRGVNDAPSGTDKTLTIVEDGVLTIRAADFGIVDPDDDSLSAVTITTLPGAGTLSLNGAAVITNQSVSLADLNADLLTFEPAANENGSAYSSFTFQVQDDGGTADGGIDLDPNPNTLTIDVLSVADEPAGADQTVTVFQDTPYTLNAADFGFTDPNDSPADSFTRVQITALPGAGTLTNDGAGVSVDDFISIADIVAGKLQFTPAAGETGTGYANIAFRVEDDGATDTSGVVPITGVTTSEGFSFGANNSGSHTLTSFTDAAGTFTDLKFVTSITSAAPTGSSILHGDGTVAPANGTVALTDNRLDTGALGPGNGQIYQFGEAIQDTDRLFVFFNNVSDPVVTIELVDGSGTLLGSQIAVGLSFADTTTGRIGTIDLERNDGQSATLFGRSLGGFSIEVADFGVSDATQIAGVRLIGSGDEDINLVGFANLAGGVNLDSTANTLTFDVVAPDAAPQGSDKTVTINQDSTFTLTASDFGFSDPGDTPPDNLAAVLITTLPSSGTLNLNGSAVSQGDLISIADINANLLTFTPAPGAFGTAYADFTFQVQDDGTGFISTTDVVPITGITTAEGFVPGEGGTQTLTSFSDPGGTYSNLIFANSIAPTTGAEVLHGAGGSRPASATLALTDDRLDTGVLNSGSLVFGFPRSPSMEDKIFVFTNFNSPPVSIQAHNGTSVIGSAVTVGSSSGLLGTFDFIRNNDAPLSDREIFGFAIEVADLGVGDPSTITGVEIIESGGTDFNLVGFASVPPGENLDPTPNSITFDVTAVPTITAIGDQTIDEDALNLVTTPISFTIGHVVLADSSLTVSASSDNQALVPDANLITGGSDANRTLTVKPAANANSPANGTATITISVFDGTNTTTETFTVTVNAVEDGPDFSVTDITRVEDNGDQASDPATTYNNVPVATFNNGGGGTDESEQTLSGYTIVSATNIALFDGGTQPSINNSGEVTFTTASNANGFSDVTVRATDSGGGTSDRTFRITVTPENEDSSANLGSDEDTDTTDLPFSLGNLQQLLERVAPTASAVVIKSFPTPSGQSNPEGNLQLNGVQVAADQEIAISDTGNLIFTPDTTGTSTWNGTLRLSYQIRNADGTLTGEIIAAFRASEAKPLTESTAVGGATSVSQPRQELAFFDPAFLRFFGDELREKRADLFSRLEQSSLTTTDTTILGFSESGNRGADDSTIDNLLDGSTGLLIFNELDDFHRTIESLTGTPNQLHFRILDLNQLVQVDSTVAAGERQAPEPEGKLPDNDGNGDGEKSPIPENDVDADPDSTAPGFEFSPLASAQDRWNSSDE